MSRLVPWGSSHVSGLCCSHIFEKFQKFTKFGKKSWLKKIEMEKVVIELACDPQVCRW